MGKAHPHANDGNEPLHFTKGHSQGLRGCYSTRPCVVTSHLPMSPPAATRISFICKSLILYPASFSSCPYVGRATAVPCSSPGLQDSSQEAQHPSWSRALGGSLPLTHSLKKLPAETFCPCCPPDIRESSQVNSSSKGRSCTGDLPLRGSRAEDTGKGLAQMGPQIPTGQCP